MNSKSGSSSLSSAAATSQQQKQLPDLSSSPAAATPSRYVSQKRRDWNTFLQYLKNHKPPVALSRCSVAHVIEFLKYHDQFRKTKVHITGCPYFSHPNPPAPCACPLNQAWGSLDALIGRIRAAYEENGGQTESNPFGARAVRIYLREGLNEKPLTNSLSLSKHHPLPWSHLGLILSGMIKLMKMTVLAAFADHHIDLVLNATLILP